MGRPQAEQARIGKAVQHVAARCLVRGGNLVLALVQEQAGLGPRFQVGVDGRAVLVPGQSVGRRVAPQDADALLQAL